MTEAAFKAKVRRALHKDVHCSAFGGQYANGVPDHWYSGTGGDLWVEYKYEPAAKVFTPKLSGLQELWLSQRMDEGRSVAVIVGTSMAAGLILLNGNWRGRVRAEDAVPFRELIEFIEHSTRRLR